MPERRIGVFLCYCGSNIEGVVDMDKLQEAVQDLLFVREPSNGDNQPWKK